MIESRRYLICLLAVLYSGTLGVVNAQEVFNYDFEDAAGVIESGYSYGFTFAGFGSSGFLDPVANNTCSDAAGNFAATNMDSSADVSFSADTVGSVQTIADFSTWTDAAVGGPAEPGVACWNYAGIGAGVGHVNAYTDDVTSELVYTRKFTSNDLSQYTLTYDAWIEGVDPIGLDATVRIDFQGPERDANDAVISKLQIGTTGDLVAAGLSAPMFLDSTPTTFTLDLSLLQELGTLDADMDGNPDQFGSGPGSVTEWQAGNWADTTQFQFQIQAQGDASTIGLDADNILHIDNVQLVAPHVVIVIAGPACDFDTDGACNPLDLDLLYLNFGTDGIHDVDVNGVVDEADINAWLTAASDPTNPFNVDSKTFVIGDLDFDGAVNSVDLGLLLNNFNDDTGLLYEAGNVNGDMNVDSVDLGQLLNNFNFTSASVSAVPEPSSPLLMLVAFSACVAMIRRKR